MSLVLNTFECQVLGGHLGHIHSGKHLGDARDVVEAKRKESQERRSNIRCVNEIKQVSTGFDKREVTGTLSLEKLTDGA